MRRLTASARMASVQMLLRETTLALLTVGWVLPVLECCEVEALIEVRRHGIGAAPSPLRFRDGN